MVLAFGLYGIEHFLACVLATRFPEHVYTGEQIDDALVICFVAENLMSCFCDIIEHIQSGGRVMELDAGVRNNFIHLLAEFGRKISDWNRKNQAPLLQRIQDALANLVSVPFQHSEVDRQITMLRTRYEYIAGPESIRTLDAEVQEIVRHKAATIIQERWRAWRHHLHRHSLQRIAVQNIINNPEEIDENLEELRHEMNKDFIDRLLDIKIRAHFILPHTSLCQKEFSQHSGVDWESLTSFIEKTHTLIHQHRTHRPQWSKIKDTLVAVDVEWAEMNVNVFPGEDDDPKVMDTSFAQAVIVKGNFSFKPQELVFKPSKFYESSIFDLGKTFPQFRDCRIVSHYQMDQHAASLIETQHSLYFIIVNSPGCKAVSVINASNTIFIMCSKDEMSIPNIGIAVIEVRHCAFCGEPATQKCSTCWRNGKLCIRYCSKECTIWDRNRHSAICGTDFPSDWCR